MLFDLSKNKDRELYKEHCNYLYKQRKYIEINVISPPRSLKQNAYMHMIISWWGYMMGYSAKEAKDYFKTHVNPDIFIDEGTGEVLSTSAIDMTGIALAITRFRYHSLKINGLDIPCSKDAAAMRQISNDLKTFRAKQYL